MKQSLDYISLKINGMHYVREIKKGDNIAYLLIDNKNKPVKNVYFYFKYLFKEKCSALNSIERIAHDLCHFFDFMLFNNIDEELLTYELFCNFLENYLPIIDPSFRATGDVINRSMLSKIPVFGIYRQEKVSVINKSGIGSFTDERIAIIANNVKRYLQYLRDEQNYDISMDSIFSKKDVLIRDETLLKHIPNKVRYKRIYTVTPILKRTGKIVNRERIRPIEIHKIFESQELNYFFKILNKDFNPVYQFLFYLLSVTGLRISEALALKITDYTYSGLDIEFDNKNWDITLDSSTENQWHIKIVVRNDNPSDLKVKFNKPRNFVISDQSYEFRNLFKNYLIYRNLCLKKHNNKTDFLFVNRTGKRLRYQSVYNMFYKVLKASLEGATEDLNISAADNYTKVRERLQQLTIHSFRHTFASLWIKANKAIKNDISLKELAYILGHSSFTITQKTYIHFFNDDIKKLRNSIDAARHQKG